MLKIENKEIHINRGDKLLIEFSIDNENEKYIFQKDDKIKFSIYRKKEMDKPPVLQKEFTPAVGTTSVDIEVSSQEMKLDDIKNKAMEYWYEIELNGNDTIIGYDDEGAKKLFLYPEGADN